MNYQLSMNRWSVVKNLLFDAAAVAIIFSVPALAHLVSFPLYYLEPMRLMLILAIVHTTKRNGYLLALILPLCSWIFSGHPEFVKMLVITVELVVNVTLFYWIYRRISKPFAAMLLAVLASKSLCYFLYWVFFPAEFLEAETGMKFILVQLAVTLAFSLYAGLLKSGRMRALFG